MEIGPSASTAVIVFIFSSVLFAAVMYFYCSRCSETQRTLQSLPPLPVVPYRKTSESLIRCVVCLSEFEESEDLKVIPGCGHVFHPQCIDGWIERRHSCPVCRCSEFFGLRHESGEAATRTEESAR